MKDVQSNLLQWSEASALACIIESHSSTQWSINCETNEFTPLPATTVQFPPWFSTSFHCSLSLLPISSFQPHRQKTLSDESTAVSWMVVLPRFSRSLQTGLTAAHSMGLFNIHHIPKTYCWTKMPQFPAHSPIHSKSTYIGIYSLSLEAGMSSHGFCCTEHIRKQRWSYGFFLFFPIDNCTTAKQAELHCI